MWKPLENPYSPVMPGAFSKIIIYIIIIKHLYGAINKCKTPVNVGKALSLPQALVGWQWLHGWPVVAEVRAGRTGTVVVLTSQGGVRAAEPPEAMHKEPERVGQKDRKINFGQTGGIRWKKEEWDCRSFLQQMRVHFSLGNDCYQEKGLYTQTAGCQFFLRQELKRLWF